MKPEAYGSNGIEPSLLWGCPLELFIPLMLVCQKSTKSLKIPDTRMCIKITPVSKPGSAKSRPIASIPTMMKPLDEKVL